MGMFDYLYCELDFPKKDECSETFQTKDTPAQMLDNYFIGKDGFLYHENYDSKFIKETKHILGGYIKSFNKRKEKVDFTGDISFYSNYKYRAKFKKGKLQSIDYLGQWNIVSYKYSIAYYLKEQKYKQKKIKASLFPKK